jgi:hypothetical protein
MLYKEVLPGEAFRKLCFLAPAAFVRSALAGQREKKTTFERASRDGLNGSISHGLYAILEDIILRETRDHHH